MTVEEEEALDEIQEHARCGRVMITDHAEKRMAQRSVWEDDIYEAIATAESCEAQDDGTWRVQGWDFDEDELTLIIAIEGENVIITVF